MMCNSKNAIKIVVNVVFMHMPMFLLTKNNCGQRVTERKRLLFRDNSSLVARVSALADYMQ